MGELAENGLNKKIQDSATISKEVDGIEAELAELRHLYEQFFLGLERKPPNTEHQAFRKRLQRLKSAFVRQTALKFRINALQAKVVSYERLWERTLTEIENGTYKRDVLRAKKHLQHKPAAKSAAAAAKEDPNSLPVDEIASSIDSFFTETDAAPDPELAQPARTHTGSFQISAEPPAARPASGAAPAAARPVSGAVPAAARPASGASPAAARPATGSAPVLRPAAPAPATAKGNEQLSDAKLRAVYDAFVTAKKRCAEDVSKLSYDSVAANLRKQVPELMKKSGAQSVEFKVVIKDGKAILRAIPK